MLAKVAQCFVLPDKPKMWTKIMFFYFACIWVCLHLIVRYGVEYMLIDIDPVILCFLRTWLFNFTAMLCWYKNQRDYDDEFIFWDITSCNLLKIDRRFGGTCRFHLQGRRISQARNWRQGRWLVCSPPKACFLLGLFFDPEDSGNMFLQNISWLSIDYTALHSRRWNPS
jgi:hypothetical protein